MNTHEKKFKTKVVNAAKWSTITEIGSKLATPISSMVLARILAPEAFGVVATVMMIVSFVEMFTDAGFQKYLIQHEFKNETQKFKNANVAFWTNLGISIVLWAIIAVFSEPIAKLVGNPGLGIVLIVACIQLPLSSFSSIQMALYKRDFDFKTLFLVRMVAVFMPFVITIPLALFGLGYWALIIGTIFVQISNAFILTIKSKWKPKFFYNFKILKEMLSFSIWSLIEAISIWFTVWIDAFIISSVLSAYHLGLYKTSTTMVNSLLSLITAAIVPVLFSTLSRLQNDEEKFNATFFKVQRMVSILVFPLGIGIYLFSDLVTQIILGGQWSEASDIVGIWSLTSSLVIVFSHFCSEAYRAKGRPKLSFLSQVLHLIFLVPTCIVSAKYGFWTLIFARSWIRLQGSLVHFILMKFAIGIPIFKTFKNIFPTAISAIVMGIIGYILRQWYQGLLWDILSIIICVIVYFGILMLSSSMRKEILQLVNSILGKFKNKNGKSQVEVGKL